MLASTITQKGQATIPQKIRSRLGLHSGDKVVFEIKGDDVVLRKIEPFDLEHHKALENTLSEWDSEEDDIAFKDL